MSASSGKKNKFLFIIVIVLFLVLVGAVVWQIFKGTPYAAVYLRTGDLYFGKLVAFPNFGLKNVYLIQANPQDKQGQLSIQKFINVFWGPEDYLKISRSQVVWVAKLRSDSSLVQLLKNNPDLTSPQQNPALQGQAPAPAPAPEPQATPEPKQ